MKRCKKCGVIKEEKEFHIKTRYKESIYRWNICRVCKSEMRKGKYTHSGGRSKPRKAHYILKQAIYYGKIQKPNKCEICGKIKCQINGHHADYLKPLTVRWVCNGCHKMLHRGW